MSPRTPTDRCPTCHRKHKRTHPQNARYWLLLHKVAANVKPNGQEFSPDTWHTWAKSKFLGCDDVRMPNGRTLAIPKSSADLPIDEFTTFMDAVEHWAMEHGVFLDE